jgi:pyrophosphatase PpaX
MLKAVVFDYDGTIADTIPAIFSEYQRVAGLMGLREVSFDEFKKVIGLPWEDVLQTLWPKIKTSEFSSLYRGEMEKPKLFSGVQETLRGLSQKYALGILTSRGRKTLMEQTEEIGLDRVLFKGVFYKDNSKYHKPDGRALTYVFEQMNVVSSEAVYVGDGFVDAICARSAGCRFIGVLSGGLTREDFISEGVSEVLSDISELPQII